MPERLERVHVATRYGLVEISWTAREAILNELRRVDSARGAVHAFEAVGAPRPVELDREGKAAVVDAIRVLATSGSFDSEIAKLRHKLVDELNASS